MHLGGETEQRFYCPKVGLEMTSIWKHFPRRHAPLSSSSCSMLLHALLWPHYFQNASDTSALCICIMSIWMVTNHVGQRKWPWNVCVCASAIREPHLLEKGRPRCHLKSPTVQDVFQLIPGLISCTGITERLGLLSHELHKMQYRNFRERKLSQISRFCGYSQRFSPQNLGVWHLWRCKSEQPAKVFSTKIVFFTNSRKFSPSKVSRYTVISMAASLLAAVPRTL